MKHQHVLRISHTGATGPATFNVAPNADSGFFAALYHTNVSIKVSGCTYVCTDAETLPKYFRRILSSTRRPVKLCIKVSIIDRRPGRKLKETKLVRVYPSKGISGVHKGARNEKPGFTALSLWIRNVLKSQGWSGQTGAVKCEVRLYVGFDFRDGLPVQRNASIQTESCHPAFTMRFHNNGSN